MHGLLRSSLAITLAVMCVLCAGLWGTAAPAGGEPVTFKTADSSVTAPIPATVYRPQGTGPFPGVVLLHDCSGLHSYQGEWAAWLQGLGYVAIRPDSLAPRIMTTACTPQGLTMRDQALDGLGALMYLRSRTDVIPTKVAVMGWSFGGGATLISASARFINATHPDGGGYQVAIALYPVCNMFQDGDLATPMLMLLGSADDWTPPGRCVESGTALQGAAISATWTVYPGATHGFDQLGAARVVHIAGHTYHLQYDATAAADAHTQVQRYLSTYLQ